MGQQYSIIVDDLTVCAECGSRIWVEVHHCIHGTGLRKLADKYHLVVGLCHYCHMRLHDKDHKMDRKYQHMAMVAFERHHQDLDFLKIFGRRYYE